MLRAPLVLLVRAESGKCHHIYWCLHLENQHLLWNSHSWLRWRIALRIALRLLFWRRTIRVNPDLVAKVKE